MYKKLFQNAMDAIFVAHADTGIIVDCNQAACDLVGRKRAELIGSPQASIYPPREIRDECNATVKQHLDYKEGVILESQVITKKGEIRDVAIKANVCNVDGKSLIQGIFRDITHNKQSERELERYRNTLNELVIERTKTIKKIAEMCVQLAGEQELILSKSVKSLSEILSVKMACLSEILGTEVNYLYLYADGKVTKDAGHCELKGTPCQVVKKKKDVYVCHNVQDKFPKAELLRQHHAVSYCGVPCLDDKGEILAVLSIIDDKQRHYSEEDLDIIRIIGQRIGKELEQRKAELKLRKSEERYTLIIEGVSDGIWDRDLVTGEAYFSPRWKAMLGYKDEEFTNNLDKFYEIIHPDDIARVRETIQKHFDGETAVYNTEFRVCHKGGSYRWIQARGATKRGDDGKPLRFAGSHTDITEKKLTEEELLKAQRLESVGMLAGGIAHDFNNILTGVLTNIEAAKICLEDVMGKNNEIFAMLDNALAASGRATGLTKQLLAFSKGGAPVIRVASIGELVRESAAFILSGSNVRRRCLIPEETWSASIDEAQISQVINNILINAKQAMPDGGNITIKTENMTVSKKDLLPLDEREYIKIIIRDTGVGIPKNILPRIFDPYFTTKKKGSGLGLATSYAIIKKHKGHITVDSNVGKGTTFNLYLPKAAGNIEKIPDNSFLPAGQMHLKILLLEDEEVVSAAFKSIMASTGCRLDHVIDGKAAIKQFKREKERGSPYDLVILDLTIPGGMGGKAAIKKLKEIDPHVKAMLCSGYSDDDVISRFGDYGFCCVLPKPFTRNEVLMKIRTIFG